MSQTYADVYPITVTRPGGSAREMRDVTSISVTTTQEKEPKFPMRRKRVASGFSKGPRKVTFEMECDVPTAGLEIDWFEIQASGEECLGVIEHGDGGERRQLVGFVVDEITDQANGEGKATARIRGKAIDYVLDRSNPVTGG